MAALGALSVGTYVYGVIEALDQPDRSWIFWGSIFFFMGIPLLGGGLVLVLWGRSLARPRHIDAARARGADPPGPGL